MLIYSRLELKFFFSLKGFLERLRASTIKSKLVEMRRSLALHSPFFSAPQRACILIVETWPDNVYLFGVPCGIPGYAEHICTLTGVVPVAKKARYGHEVGLEMRRTHSL